MDIYDNTQNTAADNFRLLLCNLRAKEKINEVELKEMSDYLSEIEGLARAVKKLIGAANIFNI